MSDIIDEITNNMDDLYRKHRLKVEAIKVSQQSYIKIQNRLIDIAMSNFIYGERRTPLTIDGVPVIIDDDIECYDYELVTSIPSYIFREKKVKK